MEIPRDDEQRRKYSLRRIHLLVPRLVPIRRRSVLRMVF